MAVSIESTSAPATSNDSNESYILSHDVPEYTRLDKQSHAIWLLMGGRHVHAPIPEDATLLIDVGCGFGNVSRSLAEDHPRAQVLGIDLAPVPVPGDKTLPANLSFIQGNVLDLAGVHAQLQPNTADLIFSRLLAAGLKGGLWPTYVKAMANLLKPGGYLNMVDLSMSTTYECTDPSRPVETKRAVVFPLFDELHSLGAENGFDFDCGKNLEMYMKDAGLVDIQVREFPYPMGTWLMKDYPPVRGFGFDGQATSLAASLSMLYRSRLNGEQLAAKARELGEEISDGKSHFILMYAVTGRKP